MWTILKSLLNLLQYCFCFVFWPLGMWDLRSPTRDQTRIPCIVRQSRNHWTTRPACTCLKENWNETSNQQVTNDPGCHIFSSFLGKLEFTRCDTFSSTTIMLVTMIKHLLVKGCLVAIRDPLNQLSNWFVVKMPRSLEDMSSWDSWELLRLQVTFLLLFPFWLRALLLLGTVCFIHLFILFHVCACVLRL